MTQDLRDLLHRVADDVTPVEVAPDTWRRARRARSRDRIVVPALAVLLVLAGVTATLRPTWLPAPVDPVDRPVVVRRPPLRRLPSARGWRAYRSHSSR